MFSQGVGLQGETTLSRPPKKKPRPPVCGPPSLPGLAVARLPTPPARMGRPAFVLAGVVCLIMLVPAIGLAKLDDIEALRELYESAGGAGWKLADNAPGDGMMLPGGNNGWDLNSDPCPMNFTNGWYGVACVDPCYTPIDGEDCRFGRITGIQMPFNTMLGSIPNNVFSKLNNLTIFDVSHNSLSGTLPTEVGKLRNMM